MSTNAPESINEMTARLRQERWDRQVASFWHNYAATPETQARFDAQQLAAREDR